MINEVLEALHLQTNKEEEMNKIYDNFQRPPKITTAMKHAMATKFATPNQEIDLDNTNVCPCCGLPTINNELPLCSSRKNFSFNGSGVALYFDFTAYTTIILAIYIIIGSIWNIVDDVQGTRCDLEANSILLCSKNFNNIFSRANVIYDHNSFVIGSALNFCACFTIMITTLYYRRHLNRIAMELDDASILASDYSIVVSNLPRNVTEQEIRQYFSQSINNTEIQLKKISMAYEIQSYLELDQQKIKKENVLTRILEMEAAGKSIPSRIPPRAVLQQSIKEISERLDFLELNKDTSFTFSGVAYLSFNYEKQADIVCHAHTATHFTLILEQFGFTNQSKKFNHNTILVKKAPEPGDIIWGNLGITPWQQEKRVWYTNLITVLLLILALALLFGVSYAQYEINNSMDQNSLSALAVITVLGLFASILISMINIFLAKIIIKFAQSERHSTRTSYDVSVAKKLGIAQFLNTAILTLIVNFAIKDSGEPVIVSIWKIGGLNADLMLIFIINSIVPWLYQLFDPDFLYKMYVRQKIIQEGDRCKYTQQEANEAFEGPKLDLSLKYAQLTKSLMFAFFYAYLLPLGLIFTFFGIICTYWTEKYLLLRRQSKPPPTGSAMAEAMVEFYVELILIIFSIGCCVWEAIIFKELHPLTWAQLAISILYYVMPIDVVFGCIVQTGIDNATVESYDEKHLTFYDDYDRYNPITKDAAMEAWKKLQQETVLLPQLIHKANQIVPI